MSKLLYIQASPRVDRSNSRAVADVFFQAYMEVHPDSNVITRDLFKDDLPPFDGLAVQAKYTILHGKNHTNQELQAWKAIEKVINEFTSADKYLIAVPMWNFGIPYRLKHYIDILTQPGYTFSFTPEEGYKGLIKGKSVLAIYARGGEYPSNSDLEAMDFQKRYLDLILGFIGITDIKSIILEPTLMGDPDVISKKKEAAVQQARELAKDF